MPKNQVDRSLITRYHTARATRPVSGLHGFWSALLTVTLLVALVVPAHAQETGATSDTVTATSNDFGACESLSEDAVRNELNVIAQSIFAGEGTIDHGAEQLAPVDLNALVAQEWAAQNMDAALDAAVADAVAYVGSTGSMLDTFLSGWSPDKAEELTAEVAQIAFSSESFRRALDDLSMGIALGLETQIGLLSAETVSQNLLCLQRFIEQNYSSAIVDAFRSDVQRGADAVSYTPGNELDQGILAVLDQHRPALGGLGVIIAAQISKKLVQRLGRSLARRVAGRVTGRLLGRVGSTVIPLAGWIIGGGLIVYDVVDSLDGALPFIEQSLTSDEVKAAIQVEVVNSIAPELRRELPQVARDVADDLYTSWLDFKRQYRQLLTWAEQSARFDAVLAAHTDVAELALLLDTALDVLGPEQLTAALDDGTFAQLAALPAGAAPLLKATGSPDAVLAWAALTPEQLDAVAELGLAQQFDPHTVDAALVTALLALDEPAAQANLAQLEPATLAILFSVSRPNLIALAREMDPAELTELAVLIDMSDEAVAAELITTLVNEPAAMRAIIGTSAGRAVVASRDLGAAVAFMNRPADALSAANDLMAVLQGKVGLRLFGAKYGWPVTAAAFGLPLLIALGLLVSLLGLIVRPFVALGALFRRSDRR